MIARFTQEDTYRGDGLNLYAYCKNNPVKYVDPTGNACESASSALKKAQGNNSVDYSGVKSTLQGTYKSSTQNSTILSKELELAGVSKQSSTAAHHIVAVGNERAVNILNEVGINVNSSVNGVRLPTTSASTIPGYPSAALHVGRHTNIYNSYVLDMLEDSMINGKYTQEGVIKVLNSVRDELLEGILKLNKN